MEPQFEMYRYKVTYIYANEKRPYFTWAHDLPEAEENFKIWAKDLDGPVKHKKTERVEE